MESPATPEELSPLDALQERMHHFIGYALSKYDTDSLPQTLRLRIECNRERNADDLYDFEPELEEIAVMIETAKQFPRLLPADVYMRWLIVARSSSASDYIWMCKGVIHRELKQCLGENNALFHSDQYKELRKKLAQLTYLVHQLVDQLEDDSIWDDDKDDEEEEAA